MSRSGELPRTDHEEALLERIRERIREAGGSLPFSAFMEMALYEPGLGYYSAGRRKLGAGGDFVTAPELTSLFGGCIARQCAEVLAACGGDILEFGAGSGRLAAQVLTALDALGMAPGTYRILEVSADLRERQRRCVADLPPHLAERVVWLDAWPREPVRGVVLANEVLDALPIERFVVRGEGVRALGVAIAPDGTLAAHEQPAQPELAAAYARLARALPHELADGYTSELSLRTVPWIASLAEHFEQGVALLVDYGLPRAQLYHPQRASGTLACHYRHLAHDDPFANVGRQDITAWVDFTALAEGALDAGFDLLGFTTQAAFLLGTGIEERLHTATTDAEHARRASEARQLLLPGEMGEAFKVLALGLGYDAPLCGFSVRDLRDGL